MKFSLNITILSAYIFSGIALGGCGSAKTPVPQQVKTQNSVSSSEKLMNITVDEFTQNYNKSLTSNKFKINNLVFEDNKAGSYAGKKLPNDLMFMITKDKVSNRIITISIVQDNNQQVQHINKYLISVTAHSIDVLNQQRNSTQHAEVLTQLAETAKNNHSQEQSTDIGDIHVVYNTKYSGDDSQKGFSFVLKSNVN